MPRAWSARLDEPRFLAYRALFRERPDRGQGVFQARPGPLEQRVSGCAETG
jgi:hypothetical protein